MILLFSWKETLNVKKTSPPAFNLIFIHLQKSLILVSYQVAQGVDKYYFYLLFGIILVLIPYYRIRVRLFIKKPEETK